jgi:hypothetical protein
VRSQEIDGLCAYARKAFYYVKKILNIQLHEGISRMVELDEGARNSEKGVVETAQWAVATIYEMPFWLRLGRSA